jgi:hypothetical protein
MKAKLFILLCTVFFILISCCKEYPPIISEPEVSLLVGNWNVLSIDSGMYPSYPGSQFLHLDSLDYKGVFTFNDNCTGSIDGSVVQITCNRDYFTWVYNDSLEKIYFIFENDKCSKGEVTLLTKDSLLFDFKDYCRHPHPVGGYLYYKFTFIKDTANTN